MLFFSICIETVFLKWNVTSVFAENGKLALTYAAYNFYPDKRVTDYLQKRGSCNFIATLGFEF